ncbi:MAG: hypothetical protein ACJ74Z_10330 [Bryobacteraceae bacterium]
MHEDIGALLLNWLRAAVVRFLAVAWFCSYSIKVEYADRRKIRDRNKTVYRFAHWPIWIWVFFIAPGPLTFSFFARGPSWRHLMWLLVVVAGTGIAGFFGQLPGVESRPYILRFCEDKPNPLYRRVCYTFAWNAILNFAILNLVGLLIAAITGSWYLKQIYSHAYFPLFAWIVCLGAIGALPRVGRSTKGEGTERRYFYGAVWAVTIAQVLLLIMWKTLPSAPAANHFKLTLYVVALGLAGAAATLGLLPRTRPIVPGELLVAD